MPHETYPSLKPIKSEQPKQDKQRKWMPPGCVTKTSYEVKLLKDAFKKGDK